MNHYQLTGPARADMRAIWRYVASFSEPHADRLIDDLIARFQEIADQPLLLGSEDEVFDSGFRTSVAGDYVVFYAVVTSGIEVVRVIHGSRDIEGMSPI